MAIRKFRIFFFLIKITNMRLKNDFLKVFMAFLELFSKKSSLDLIQD